MSEPAKTTPLPRGRHGLTTHEAQSLQRARTRRACLDVVGEVGYGAASVADLVAAAGISRRTFYELYASKLACFQDAVLGWEAELMTAVEREVRRGDGHAALAVALRRLAADPRAARCMMLERENADATGTSYAQGRRDDWDALVMRATGLTDGFAVRLLVSAITGIVRSEVRTGGVAALERFEAPLVRYASAYVAAAAAV